MDRRVRIGRRATAALGACLLALGTAPLAAQSDAELKQEIEALKLGQQQIRQELSEIKTLLQQQRPSRPSGPNVSGKIFDLGDKPVKGTPKAKLTLIEFLDYQ
ncbi:MAG: hypothetical protein AAF560_21140 [Acidobacteriota bacterium]